MSKSSQFIRATLVNRTNADCSFKEVKNNRFHYLLRFEKSIGFDWLKKQVQKAQGELDVQLELWEIHPSGVDDFEIEVREVERREGIDDNQCGLTEFES
jgi:hypothetical protein